MKVGVFTVMLPDLTPEEAARELRLAGYDGVEWRVTRTAPGSRQGPPSFWGNNLCTLEPSEADAGRARRLAAAEGLEIPSLGTYLAVGDLEAVNAAMRFARLAGAGQVRVGVGSPEGGYRESFGRASAFLAEVEPLAREHGVRALVELHHGTICPSASLAHRLVSRFDPSLIGVIVDPGNMAQEGFEDYRLGIELLGPHLAHAHLKNSAWTRPEGGGRWTPRWSPLDDGVVDVPGFVRALHEAGYGGWLVVEDFSAVRPSREALRHNIAVVKDAVGQISA